MDNEKTEVMRYLGRRGHDIPQELDKMAEECLNELRDTAKPRHVKAVFSAYIDYRGVLLKDADFLLEGNDIRRRLACSARVMIFAATLGIEADNIIRVNECINITRALVLDACATHLIESYCDEIEEKVREEAKSSGLRATLRFSPGYGDLPLDIQPGLLSLLDAERKIGLTCNNSLIMLPRKSVTAIIGIGDNACDSGASCVTCNLNKLCNFRR